LRIISPKFTIVINSLLPVKMVSVILLPLLFPNTSGALVWNRVRPKLAFVPPWLKKCFEDNCKILMARVLATGTVKKKEK
jgi:hypothetical protein